MDTYWPTKIKEALCVGHSLHAQGIRNWALTKTQVLRILERFSDSEVVILGGSVMTNSAGQFSYNYDGWTCDAISSESRSTHQARSISTAIDYVNSYSLADRADVFFVLTPVIPAGSADEILLSGRLVDCEGKSSRAFSKREAIDALGRLTEAGIAVRTCQVYVESENSLRVQENRIFTQKLPGEDSSQFLLRSVRDIRAFIETNANSEIESTYFVFETIEDEE